MKILTLLLIICLITPLIDAQDTPTTSIPPQTGLDKLIQAINDNTIAQNATQKKVEDEYGFLAEQNRSWAGVIIAGVSTFILAFYLIIVFFERRRKRMQKKSYEEVIEELNAELKAAKEGMIETLTHVNEETAELLRKNQLLYEDMQLMRTFFTSEAPKTMHPKRTFIMGMLTGFIIFLAIKAVGGG